MIEPMDRQTITPLEGEETQISDKFSELKALGISLEVETADISEEEEERLYLESQGITIINPASSKLAVIELSNRAVKFLCGDVPKLAEFGFNFDFFMREAYLTGTGKGTDWQGYMELEFISENVIPVIEKVIQYAENLDVGKIITIGTSVFRSVNNSEELIEFIRQETGINVKTITPNEEAEFILDAFKFSKPESFRFESGQKIVLIDQGGGSTEIAVFNCITDYLHEADHALSLEIGSTLFQSVLFDNKEDTPLTKGFELVDELIKVELQRYFSTYPIDYQLAFGIGVGSAITKATKKTGNKNQHGCSLSKAEIEETLKHTEEKLLRNFKTTGALYLEVAKQQKLRKKADLENDLIMRLGLPFYLGIMEHYGLENFIVSGTGLWYGVYFDAIRSQYIAEVRRLHDAELNSN